MINNADSLMRTTHPGLLCISVTGWDFNLWTFTVKSVVSCRKRCSSHVLVGVLPLLCSRVKVIVSLLFDQSQIIELGLLGISQNVGIEPL